jgi:hypothetical protein
VFSGGGLQGFDRWNIRRNPCTAPAGPYFSERSITKYLLVRDCRPPEHKLICINIMQRAIDIVEGLKLMLVVLKSHHFISSPHMFPCRCRMICCEDMQQPGCIEESGFRIGDSQDKRDKKALISWRGEMEFLFLSSSCHGMNLSRGRFENPCESCREGWFGNCELACATCALITFRTLSATVTSTAQSSDDRFKTRHAMTNWAL